MDAEVFESMLEGMLQLRLDPPQVTTAHLDGATDQLAAAAVPAQPAAAAGVDHVNQTAGEWTELLVSEMVSATSVDDARCRAARILEAFGGVVCSRAAQVLGDKDRLLGTALQQNAVLKRAVVVQHRRHLEDEEKGKELQGQVVQYQEQVRRLEADKYALSTHLRNAGGGGGGGGGSGSSMPGNFHPEVF